MVQLPPILTKNHLGAVSGTSGAEYIGVPPDPDLLPAGGTLRSALDLIGNKLTAASITAKYGVSIEEFEYAIPSASKPGSDKSTWDWSAAFAEYIVYAKSKAIYDATLGTYDRLPPLYIPYGYYQLNPATANLNFFNMRGVHIEGAGPSATVLKLTGAGTLFTFERTYSVVLSNLTLDTGVLQNIGGTNYTVPRENTTACLIKQLSTTTGWSAVGFTFDNVEFRFFHKGVRFEGDQMCDRVVMINPRFYDCFSCLEYYNPNAVNHVMIGGETNCFNDLTEATYNSALAGWAGAPSIYDGAFFRIRQGGSITWLGGSFIHKYTSVLFDHAAGVSAVEHVTFDGGRWEYNSRDTAGDAWGQERTCLVRRTEPTLADADVKTQVNFSRCRIGHKYGTNTDTVKLFYLHNGMQINWDDSAFSWGGPYGIVRQVNTGTETTPGTMHITGPSSFTHIKSVTGAPAARADHVVKAPDFHTYNNNVFFGSRKYYRDLATGYLPGSAGAAQSVNITGLPAGAYVARLGVARLGAGAAAGSYTIQFRDSTGATVYQAFTVDFQAGSGLYISDTAFAVPANGIINVYSTTTTGVALPGYSFVEVP